MLNLFFFCLRQRQQILMILFIAVDDISGLPIFYLVAESLSNAIRLYPMTAILLYCMLGAVVLEFFQHLLDRISVEECTYSNLKKWKTHFEQTVQLVDNINLTFGNIILIFLTYTMGSFSIVGFRLVVKSLWTSPGDIILLTKHTVQLVAITYILHRVKDRVNYVSWFMS